MGAVSTSLDRVRGRAPPPFSLTAVTLFDMGTTPVVPFARLSAPELDSPTSPLTLEIVQCFVVQSTAFK